MSYLKPIFTFILLLLSANASAGYYGHSERTYEVTVTNVTKGVILTPILAVTHRRSINLYEVGTPASDPLIAIAEGGDTSVFENALAGAIKVTNVMNSGAPLMPGASVTFYVQAKRSDVLSLASMLLPTNDTFMALDSVRLPRYSSATYLAYSFDAGSETNDEICANIPGPQCGGTPGSPEDLGEGYIYPSPGIHGEGELSRRAYNWAGAVAKVMVSIH